MRTLSKLSLWLLLAAGALGQATSKGYVPKEGYIPDSATAITIAEAVLEPVYGKAKIESERPFTAKLRDGVWTIEGTLRCPDGKGGTTTDCAGGVATVKIVKSDGRVLFMIHYK